MGFIKKLIGNLLAFLGGLFGSFGKVLGLNKSGYFLELDESKDAQPESSAPAKAASNAPTPVVSTSNVSTSNVSTSNGASAKPEPAKPEPTKVQPVNKSAVAQTSQEQKTADASVPESKPAVSLNGSQPAPTFAPEFLMATASQNSRRRPGPSMNYFLDMAKKVKA
jgi:cytoskeletal protein RodZ